MSPFDGKGETWDETRYEYEPATGSLIKKIYPDGHEISYTYYDDLLPKRITYASGKWMERNYNSRRHAVSTIYSSQDTPAIYSTPNELGTVCRVEDAGGLIYDYGIRPYGQLLTNEVVSSPWMNWRLAHSYEKYQRESGWSLSINNVKKGAEHWTYGNEGRICGLVCTNSSGRSIEITYSYFSGIPSGYAIKTPSGSVFSQQLTRDKHRPELINRISVSHAGNRILERNFEYNIIGKLTRWHDSGSSNEAVYLYNRRREVVQADITGTRYGYGFDSAGNCKGFAIGAVTNFFVVNQLNQCVALIFPDVNGSAPHEYDLDGNLTQVPGMFQYYWDCENRLISAVTRNGTVTNRYDYQNRLVRQDAPGYRRYCIFDRWNLVFERYQYDTGNTEEIEYFWGIDVSGTPDGACGVGGLVAVSRNGNFYFPYYGINGDILGYVNESGGVVASYTYGPFGELTSLSGSMADSFQFRLMTKRYDNVLNMYDFGDRWYSVALRRWISRDPLGEDGGINLYSFCENDPVNKFDPNGCIPLDTIWDIGNIIYDICVGDDVALAADTAALMLPYVPAGSTKLVKAARLSNVKKICPGAKKIEVTYKYVHVDYHFTKGPRAAKDWVSMTRGKKKSYWKPQTTDMDVKQYIDAALRKAKAEGKIKPSQLKGYEYDVGRPIGATNGRQTSKIKIQVDSNGYIHAHPWP